MRVRLGDARLLERVHELEVELSEMDACADELEAEIEELHSDKQSLKGRVQHLEVSRCPQSSDTLAPDWHANVVQESTKVLPSHPRMATHLSISVMTAGRAPHCSR